MANIPRIKSPHDDSALNTHNRLIDVVNQLKNSAQELVVKGSLTPAQYAELLKEINGLIGRGEASVYDIDFNKGQIQPDHLSQSVKDMMAGTTPIKSEVESNSIGKNHIRQRSVGLSELTFTKRDDYNLFMGDYYHGWLGHNTIDGVTNLSTRKNYGDFNGRTAVIPVKPNTEYQIKLEEGTDNFAIGGVVDWSFEATSTSEGLEYLVDQVISTSRRVPPTTLNFTTQSNIRYVLINVSREGNEPKMMVTEGTGDNEYKQGGVIPERYIERPGLIHNLKLVKGAVNSFGVIRHNNTGSNMILEKNILLKPNFRIGLMDYSKYNINVLRWDIETGDYLTGGLGRREADTITDEYANYQIAIRKINDEDVTEEDIEDAEKLLFISYEPETDGVLTDKRFVITDDIEHEFEAFGERSFGGDEDQARDTQADEMYDLFDPIRWAHDQYFHRNLLGRGTDNHHIYEYHLTPKKLTESDGVDLEMPKILLVAGLHGNEKSTVYALYNLLNLLCNHWRENKLLEFLRWNVEFKIIPIANPSGFNMNSRMTSEGININRDFPTGWKNWDGGSGNNGDAPLHTPEAQIMYQWIQDNDDAVFGIDYHNMGPNGDYLSFVTAVDEDVNKLFHRVLLKKGRDWQDKFDFLNQSYEADFGYTRFSRPSTLGHEFNSFGIPGITLEIVRGINVEPGKEAHWYSDNTNTISLELLVESLKAIIKQVI